MEQLIEKKHKSTVKTFLIIILFVVLIDFIIFIMNKFTNTLPYITTILTVFLVTISCSYILIKYFSKYAYVLNGEQLIFNRFIGKRKFEILRIDLEDIVEIKPYKTQEKTNYKFIFDTAENNIYIGRYKTINGVNSFLFSPNEKILKELKGRKV